MKSRFFYASLVLVAAVVTSCQKESPEVLKNSGLASNEQEKTFNLTSADFNREADQLAEAAYYSRIAQTNIIASRSQSIMVPDDYPTIQDAVDAASEGTNIFVRSGSYSESVMIYTPGIKLQAMGNVQLNGSIRVRDGADNVVVKKFSVVIPDTETLGLSALNNSGVEFVQNTVTGSAGTGSNGILGVNADDMVIRGNSVSGMDWGIVLLTRTDLGDGACSGNKIFENTITGSSTVGIQLQGNVDNSKVWNNSLSNIQFNGGGNPAITVFGVSAASGAPEFLQGDCNGNIIKGNVVSNSDLGFGLAFDSFDNKVGPDNNFSSNVFLGIYVVFAGDNNLVFENTALDNGLCDIWVQSSPGNIFRDNNYDCYQEF